MGKASRGTNSPHTSSCGITTSGMNCTAWNSVVANALTKSPSAHPSTPSTTATRPSTASEPSTSSPSRPTETATASADCTSATRANARA